MNKPPIYLTSVARIDIKRVEQTTRGFKARGVSIGGHGRGGLLQSTRST